MSAHGYAARLPRAGARHALVALAATIAVGVLALAAFGVSKLLDGGRTSPSVPVYTGPGKAFRMALPTGWRALPQARLRSLANAPTAVLERSDRRGLIAVRPAPALHGTPAQISKALAAQLGSRFRGFRPVRARVARLRGGSALVYTFVRDPKGTVQTLAIAPAGGRLWELDAVVPASAPAAARQAGAMLATFGS